MIREVAPHTIPPDPRAHTPPRGRCQILENRNPAAAPQNFPPDLPPTASQDTTTSRSPECFGRRSNGCPGLYVGSDRRGIAPDTASTYTCTPRSAAVRDRSCACSTTSAPCASALFTFTYWPMKLFGVDRDVVDLVVKKIVEVRCGQRIFSPQKSCCNPASKDRECSGFKSRIRNAVRIGGTGESLFEPRLLESGGIGKSQPCPGKQFSPPRSACQVSRHARHTRYSQTRCCARTVRRRSRRQRSNRDLLLQVHVVIEPLPMRLAESRSPTNPFSFSTRYPNVVCAQVRSE